MDIQTTVSIAKTGTRSLKVTIPQEIVAYLDLQKGDMLEWKMDGTTAKRFALVKKVNK